MTNNDTYVGHTYVSETHIMPLTHKDTSGTHVCVWNTRYVSWTHANAWKTYICVWETHKHLADDIILARERRLTLWLVDRDRNAGSPTQSGGGLPFCD